MGIHDRDYMRPAEKPSLFARLRNASPAILLIIILVVCFALQSMATGAGHKEWIMENLALTGGAIKAGKLWTLITASFLHGGFLHLLFNCVGVWFIGRGVALDCGAKRFWQVYFAGVLAGSLATSLVWATPDAMVAKSVLAYRDMVPTVGASTGLMALLAYYLADKLKEVFSLLIYFVIPVKMEGYWLLGVTAGLSVVGLIFSEIPMATGWWHVGINDLSISHSGHLGGLLLGFGWARFEMYRRRPSLRILPAFEFERPDRQDDPKPLDRSAYTRLAPSSRKESAPAAGDMRGEVDRILDKINAHGFGSLTVEERAVLEKAREALDRR